MNEEKTYNGYTNYETWCIMMWIDQDQEKLKTIQEIIELGQKEEALGIEIMDAIKNYMDGFIPELEGFPADLLNAAFSEVNFYEIYEHIRDLMKEEKRYQEEKAAG